MWCTFVFTSCFLIVHEGYTERIVIHTGDQEGALYQFFPLKTNRLQFSVKATNDIHICFTQTPVLQGAWYEILIGGWWNSRCAIRKDSSHHQVEYQDAVIKPGKFQTFSITLDDNEGSIEVGKGFNEPFMYYKDPDYVKMTYFGISTGYGSKGVWNFEFSTFYCNCTTC